MSTIACQRVVKEQRHEIKLLLYRVVGAIVIVMGLYLVIWGKKKDYKSQRIEEEAIPVKQMTEIDNNGNEHSIHEVVNINLSKEGAVDRDEQLATRC